MKMQSSNSRKNILQKIAAVSNKRLASVVIEKDNLETIYKPLLPDALHCFKNELEAVSGQCIICENEQEIYNQLRQYLEKKNMRSIFCRDKIIGSQLEKRKFRHTNQLAEFEKMQIGITGCEFLIARTGSVLISSDNDSGRQMNVFPPIHIVLAHISQLVNYPKDAVSAIQEKYGEQLPSMISFITGPSRTADIEKTLVLGAHGPKEFIVLLSKE